MNCPKCRSETRVVDSRMNEDSIRRRRECRECGHRFSTMEVDVNYYATTMERKEKAFREAFFDGFSELGARLYCALGFEERENDGESD